MKYALIENGTVSNLIEWDGHADLGELRPIPVPDGLSVNIGTPYDGGQFLVDPPSEPVPTPPSSVTMRQARLALLSAGRLAEVDAAIDAMSSPDKDAARIEWDYAATVDRDSPFTQQLASALDLDDAALDELFTQAAAL